VNTVLRHIEQVEEDMRTHWVAALAVVAVGLYACDSGRSERTIRDRETGESVTVRTGPALAAPRNMPAFAPIYPGAAILSSMDGISGSSSDGGVQTGGMVSFSTKDDPERVARFYRARLDASNLTERGDANVNGAMILSGTAAEDTGDGVQISIAPSGEGEGSVVTLIYSRGNG
tara:strand:- start:1905 stop:2426 length:522 start_codon:yes stop_codon:yes gene_type:complete